MGKQSSEICVLYNSDE